MSRVADGPVRFASLVSTNPWTSPRTLNTDNHYEPLANYFRIPQEHGAELTSQLRHRPDQYLYQQVGVHSSIFGRRSRNVHEYAQKSVSAWRNRNAKEPAGRSARKRKDDSRGAGWYWCRRLRSSISSVIMGRWGQWSSTPAPSGDTPGGAGSEGATPLESAAHGRVSSLGRRHGAGWCSVREVMTLESPRRGRRKGMPRE